MEFESIGTGRVSADYSLRESRELGRSVGAVGASRCVVYSLVVTGWWITAARGIYLPLRRRVTILIRALKMFLYSALQPTARA